MLPSKDGGRIEVLGEGVGGYGDLAQIGLSAGVQTERAERKFRRGPSIRGETGREKLARLEFDTGWFIKGWTANMGEKRGQLSTSPVVEVKKQVFCARGDKGDSKEKDIRSDQKTSIKGTLTPFKTDKNEGTLGVTRRTSEKRVRRII